MKNLYVILATAILLMVLAHSVKAQSGYSAEEKKAVIEWVEEGVNKGIIKKTEVDFHKVYIDHQSWHLYNYDDKKGITKMLSIYMEIQTGTRFVKVYSYHTGKKVAKWGTFGLKLY